MGRSFSLEARPRFGRNSGAIGMDCLKREVRGQGGVRQSGVKSACGGQAAALQKSKGEEAAGRFSW